MDSPTRIDENIIIRAMNMGLTEIVVYQATEKTIDYFYQHPNATQSLEEQCQQLSEINKTKFWLYICPYTYMLKIKWDADYFRKSRRPSMAFKRLPNDTFIC